MNMDRSGSIVEGTLCKSHTIQTEYLHLNVLITCDVNHVSLAAHIEVG